MINFVGAGPGAVDLITIRGMNALKQADVVVKPDGRMNVLDIDELCEAKEKILITEEQFFISVKQLGCLIKLIQDGNFNTLTDVLMKHI